MLKKLAWRLFSDARIKNEGWCIEPRKDRNDAVNDDDTLAFCDGTRV